LALVQKELADEVPMSATSRELEAVARPEEGWPIPYRMWMMGVSLSQYSLLHNKVLSAFLLNLCAPGTSPLPRVKAVKDEKKKFSPPHIYAVCCSMDLVARSPEP